MHRTAPPHRSQRTLARALPCGDKQRSVVEELTARRGSKSECSKAAPVKSALAKEFLCILHARNAACLWSSAIPRLRQRLGKRLPDISGRASRLLLCRRLTAIAHCGQFDGAGLAPACAAVAADGTATAMAIRFGTLPTFTRPISLCSFTL